MIEKLKENTRIKLISLLSALVLWMYVMAVVDPQETKVFENIPVSITNMKDLKDNNFVIYPNVDLTTDIYVTGKLSVLQSISKDDITVFGTINDAKEGNNAMYLKASISKGVSYNFKPDTLIIPLDKIVEEKRSIDVVVDGKYKNNLDTISLEQDSMKIYGPRTLVRSVQKLQAILTLNDKVDNFSTSLELIPVDEEGNKVEGVTVENPSVNAGIYLLIEKNVPINIIFNENNENIGTYELSQNTINIKGKKEIVSKINSVNTKVIKVDDIKPGESRDVQLEIPEGTIIDSNIKLTIKFNEVKEFISKLTYTKDDVEIRNNNDSIDVSTLKIPNDIYVEVEYTEEISNLNKSDIILYIDLSEANGNYQIKYESKYEFKLVKINPGSVNT